ncbi:TIR domain-containing protein [Rhizobium lusitanum]|uniref:toll/interleukin-1 receptor domain-containing protein n=1 Tax=Rhizobium lusitanum TaxID=293958 RepID=UPI0016194343|nr:toll/interleukin-1 receptor domain-containing protein [Rhizobium lusitanum]QND46951.1 TIR domain-containing protein [Rhizobium lusitanum]
MSEELANPKLFISYCWSNQDHESWVVRFAEELVSQGVHVILDKWDLKPGNDANDFMESMVKDKTVTKVIMICDESYVTKSDGRKGGAGTEAQIITPEIYTETKQDKFVAIVRERDEQGKPFLPTYYKGRIYFDLSDPATYAEEFDKIVRWAWDKPYHQRPALGSAPSFLKADNAPGKIASVVAHRRALEGIRGGASNAVALAGEYLEIVIGGLESFRLATSDQHRETFDEIVIASIEEFTPYRNELIELFAAIARHMPTETMAELLHRFFERWLPYFQAPEIARSYSEWDFDNYRFIAHELFLYAMAAFLRFEKLDMAAYLTNTEYYFRDRLAAGSEMRSFNVLDAHLHSLEHRNKRMKLGRFSLQADMLRERNQGTGVVFHHLMAADFVLFLRGIAQERYGSWWPDTLVYTGRSEGPFEMFARAKSAKYFERLKGLLGVDSASTFKTFIEELVANRDRVPRWHVHTLNVGGLCGLASLATSP